MKKRKLVKRAYKNKYKEKVCEACKKNLAVYLYMPGRKKYNYLCESCVPKGCSCNFEYFEDKESAEEILNSIRNGEKYYLLDYSKSIKDNIINLEKEHEKIIEKEKIIEIINQCIRENKFLHIIPVPLDEKGQEYPCCEYWYDEKHFKF